jgi:multicomponent K+:H+ antiporter subunit E
MRDTTLPAGRRFPPVLIAMLLGMWLLLNQTVAPGQIVLGLLLAVTLTAAVSSLRPLQPHIARANVAARLALMVLIDITRSNIGVARIILGLVGQRDIRSGFVDIPLDMRDPHGLAVLAIIVTSTPGTVWVDLARDGSRLTLHVLDLRDESEWIHWIKTRYERPLMEIFE